ncbi:MAG: hypothetical protein O3B41_01285 [Bacteroidetes bacterium]|nr:hypothetical protein [Bacteroidota bacterium]
MSTHRILVLSLLTVLTLTSACSGDSGGSGDPVVGPGGNDDPPGPTGPIRFSQDVSQIFHASCGGSGCHVNNVKNGVNLTTYSSVMGSIGQAYGTPIVVAGNASLSPIIDKLGSNPRFGNRMPDGRSALSSSQIATISTWINEGALNN